MVNLLKKVAIFFALPFVKSIIISESGMQDFKKRISEHEEKKGRTFNLKSELWTRPEVAGIKFLPSAIDKKTQMAIYEVNAGTEILQKDASSETQKRKITLTGNYLDAMNIIISAVTNNCIEEPGSAIVAYFSQGSQKLKLVASRDSTMSLQTHICSYTGGAILSARLCCLDDANAPLATGPEDTAIDTAEIQDEAVPMHRQKPVGKKISHFAANSPDFWLEDVKKLL